MRLDYRMPFRIRFRKKYDHKYKHQKCHFLFKMHVIWMHKYASKIKVAQEKCINIDVSKM